MGDEKLDENGSPDVRLSPETIEGVSLAREKAIELNRKSATGTFQYDGTLRPGWIRVLELQPGSATDPVICSLSAQLLNAPLRYEAVSYVWGDLAQTHKITCNWRVPIILDGRFHVMFSQKVTNNFGVTDNLLKLLLHLRSADVPLTFWIDQICINQDDKDEKSLQIKLMSQIYSRASRVLIWLGEEGPDTESAFAAVDFLAAMERMSGKERGQVVGWLVSPEDLSDPDVVAADQQAGHRVTEREDRAVKDRLIYHLRPQPLGFPLNESDPSGEYICLTGIQALNHLLEERPWFGRAWVFQETVMARNAVILCGTYMRDWNVLHHACQVLLSLVVFNGQFSNRTRALLIAESIVRKGNLRNDWARLQLLNDASHGYSPERLEAMAWATCTGLEKILKQWRLKALLPEIRPAAATDPMDKVLALIGFAHDDGRQISLPDYGFPLVDLYLTVAKYWFTSEEDTELNLIKGIHPKNKGPIPIGSWSCPLISEVPDLSFLSHVQVANPEHGLPSWVPDWSSPLEAATILDIAPFRAAGDCRPPAAIDDSKTPPELHLQGVRVLTVAAVEVNPGSFKRHVEMISNFQDPYPTTSLPYPEAYRLAIDPTEPEDFQPPERFPDSPGFWEYAHQFKGLEAETSTQPKQRQQAQYTSEDLQSKLHPMHLTGARKAASNPLYAGRAFFVSTNGFMGLAPKDTVIGDCIYVLLGANVPFALRRRGDATFTLLGECYVLGLMHGEATVGVPSGLEENVILV